MGVRVEVEDGESVRNALHRLSKLKRYQLGWKAVLERGRKNRGRFTPQTEVRRKKVWDKLQMARRETYSGKRQDRP